MASDQGGVPAAELQLRASSPVLSTQSQQEFPPTLEVDEGDSPMEFGSHGSGDVGHLPRRASCSGARTVFHHQPGDADTLNSTRSLYDTDVVYFEIHGRRYCKDYYMPNDEDEQTRLQMLNGVTISILGDRLHTAPLRDPRKILDVGTGVGEWAIAMGDEYPDAEVIGTDIAKIQPTAVPLNVFFEIDDAEEEGGWTWAEDEFDFIHLRYMCGTFQDWKHIYREAYTHLKPGGWIEVVDFDDHKELLTFFPPESEVHKWTNAIYEGSEKAGRSRTVEFLEPDFLQQFGFVDVKYTEFDIPLGTWRDDEEGKRIGKHFLVVTAIGAEALCLRVLSEQLGWEYEDIINMTEAAKNQLWNIAVDSSKSQGMSFKLRCLIGRKPCDTGLSPDDAGCMEDARSSRTVTMTDAGVGPGVSNGVPTP